MTDGRRGRAGFVAAVVALLAIATTGCQSFWETFGGALVEQRAAEQFEEVHAAAEELVAARPAGLPRPSVTLEEAEGTLVLNRGVPLQLSILGFEPDDPWRVPFAGQVETELIRRAFRDGLPEETFWEAPLAERDTIVIRALSDLLEAEDAAERDRRLRDREAELAVTRERLEEATEAFARDRGLRFFSTTPMLFARFLQVPVSTQPEGGIVRMLTFLAFKKEEIRGVEPRRMPWRSVVQSPADLLGLYEVWVTWPETGQEARERVDVRSEAPLVFRPTSDPPDG